METRGKETVTETGKEYLGLGQTRKGARKGEAGRSRPRVRTATATTTQTATQTATQMATQTATATSTRHRLRRRGVYPRPGALGRLRRMRKATRDDARCAHVHGEAARAGRAASDRGAF